MAFDAAERNGKFNRIQCQRNKESSSSRGKRKVFLCIRTVAVEVGSQFILTSFLKIEGRGRLLEGKIGEKGMVSRIGR